MKTPWSRPGTRAFTLIEVMIASGILFMCLFAILGVVANCLRNARALQRQTMEIGSVAAQVSYQLANTNRVSPGTIDIDLSETFPDFILEPPIIGPAYINGEVASNGLFQVELTVRRKGRSQDVSYMVFWMYNPGYQESGASTFGGGIRR